MYLLHSGTLSWIIAAIALSCCWHMIIPSWPLKRKLSTVSSYRSYSNSYALCRYQTSSRWLDNARRQPVGCDVKLSLDGLKTHQTAAGRQLWPKTSRTWLYFGTILPWRVLSLKYRCSVSPRSSYAKNIFFEMFSGRSHAQSAYPPHTRHKQVTCFHDSSNRIHNVFTVVVC